MQTSSAALTSKQPLTHPPGAQHTTHLPPPNPFKAGLLLPRNEFYLRAHGMTQDGSALCWLELGEFTMPQFKKKKPQNPVIFGKQGDIAKWPQCKVTTGCSWEWTQSWCCNSAYIDSRSAHTDTTDNCANLVTKMGTEAGDEWCCTGQCRTKPGTIALQKGHGGCCELCGFPQVSGHWENY